MRTKILSVVLLLSIELPCLAGESQVRPYELVRSNDPHFCERAADVIGTVNPIEFVHGTWHMKFAGPEWKKESWRALVSDGHEERVNFTYSIVDIDNDGLRDVAVHYTTFLRSELVDSLYVLSPEEFDTALKDDTVGEIVTSSPRIEAGDGVVLTDGSDALPQDIRIWIDEGRTYVLLKEYFFGREDAPFASSLVVSNLERLSQRAHARDTTARLKPTVVCRFTWKAAEAQQAAAADRPETGAG